MKFLSIVTLLLCLPVFQLGAKQPNIILVMTDDQGYGDLACHGHPFIQTPNLDALHSQSTRFTDFQVSPTCAPTRAALMSGQAPFKVGVTHTILERERMALTATTIADALRNAGYTTGIFGKWHLGDEDAYQPENRGFDEVFIHGAGGIGQTYPGSQGAVPGTGYFNPIIKHNGVFEQTEGYCTDVFFQQALGWIKQNRDHQPFFAYIATNAPHSPFIVAPEYEEMYTELCRDENGKVMKDVPAFLGMITNIDENMGLLMEKLDEWGLSDDTLLIFMTDNGTARGDRIYNAGMKGRKGSEHEGGTRVPLFMRLPGVTQPGVDVDVLTRHYDIFPTLAELAGAEVPEEVDGRSLVPLIENPQAPWDDRKTYVHKARWGKPGSGRPNKERNAASIDEAKYWQFAVRTEQWRLTGRGKAGRDSAEFQLYDIQKDPGEEHNVIAEHPEVAEQLLDSYDAWWESMLPYMVNEDASLDTGKPFVISFEKQQADIGIPAWQKPEL